MAPRPSWTGAIDFGGFPIHLRAYSLIKSKSAESFKTLCPCHNAPIVAPKTCSVDGTPVEISECGKGVKVGKDIRALPPEAIEALTKGERTDVITIKDLCPRASVPLHLAQNHYRFVPDKDVAGSEGPVGILWNGLLANERVLMSEWIPRAGSRNQLIAVTADVHGLGGVVLPYVTDFNTDVPEHAFEENEQAAAMFEAFAAQQSIPMDDFAHAKYVDTYGEQRKAAIDAALAGKPIPVADAPAKAAVPDLMAAMAAAMENVPSAPKKAPAKRKPAAKKEVKTA